MAKIIITGDKAIDRKLATLGAKVANKITRSAIKKSGQLVADRARANLTASPSVDTGQLRRGIRVRALTKRKGVRGVKIETQRGLHKNKAFGGLQLEFGADHMPAEPFLRPALYDIDAQIRSDFVTDVRAAIAEAAKSR